MLCQTVPASEELKEFIRGFALRHRDADDVGAFATQALEGIDLQHSLDLNLKYSVHNHIKDGYLDEEGKVRYLLPGAGDLDMNVYFKAIRDAGWDKYICPEVTGQIWNAEGYDAWATAQFCFDKLSEARKSLG